MEVVIETLFHSATSGHSIHRLSVTVWMSGRVGKKWKWWEMIMVNDIWEHG